jgi:hypothetical protein
MSRVRLFERCDELQDLSVDGVSQSWLLQYLSHILMLVPLDAAHEIVLLPFLGYRLFHRYNSRSVLLPLETHKELRDGVGFNADIWPFVVITDYV